MVKIKGLHNAITSGRSAGEAIAEQPGTSSAAAYSAKLAATHVAKEMERASRFRQVVARFGPTFGFPLLALGRFLPRVDAHEDYTTMTTASYPYKSGQPFDKMTFAAFSGTVHREGQPSHLKILKGDVCEKQCAPKYGAPCIAFCPAGVYEEIQGVVKAANPSNCLHCKTCQRKCPFDNIRWHVPEGGGGPKYTEM
jgi:electron-transferring-flavoprotein dehydrogenase